MSRPATAMLASAALAVAVAVAGCGGGHRARDHATGPASGVGVSSTTPTPPPPPPILLVVSSLPLTGPDAAEGVAIARGMTLALAEHGSHFDGFQVHYHSLNDATSTLSFSPQREADNAASVATDEDAIAYVGDLRSGASRISIPILSSAGIPQIIPGSPATELLGTPSSTRSQQRSTATTFVRLVATNAQQAQAELTFVRSSDPTCRELALPHGSDLDSTDLARQLRMQSGRYRLTAIGDTTVNPEQATKFRAYRDALTAHHANCAIYSGTLAEGAVAVMVALHQALAPGAKIVGGSGVCTPAWADGRHGGMPAALAPDLACAAPGPGPRQTTDGTRFVKAYRAKYKQAPPPAAAYGDEAMTLTVDAIAAAGSHGDNRATVLDFLQATTQQQSVIGPFEIAASGEITAKYPYSVYVIRRGRLTYATTPVVDASVAQTHVGHIQTNG